MESAVEERNQSTKRNVHPLTDVIQEFLTSCQSPPSIRQFLETQTVEYVQNAGVYDRWSGLASSTTRKYLESCKSKFGNEVFVDTKYPESGWQLLLLAIKTRTKLKEGSLELLGAAAQESMNMLQKTFDTGDKRPTPESSTDDIVSKRNKMDNDGESINQKRVTVVAGLKSLISDNALYDGSINHNNSFWDDWVELMDKNPHCHQYDLDKYHVLQCGYDVKAKPDVPKSMYESLGLKEMKVSVLLEYKEVFTKLVAAGKKSITDLEDAIPEIAIPGELGCFVEKIFSQFVYQIFKRKRHEIDRYETTYNFRLLWPLLESVMDSLDQTIDRKFIPGEIKLEAFKKLGALYNADGLCYFDDMEVLVLETSGPYNNHDAPRWGYDHIKGTFALLAMFRSFIQKYHYALPSEFAALKLWFAHARGDMVHIWTLSMPKPNVFMLERMTKIKIPSDIKECFYICNIIKMLWAVKCGLNKTYETIEKLKKSHDNYCQEMSMDSISPEEERADLRDIVCERIQKPLRGRHFNRLLPETLSEITFDNSFL